MKSHLEYAKNAYWRLCKHVEKVLWSDLDLKDWLCHKAISLAETKPNCQSF